MKYRVYIALILTLAFNVIFIAYLLIRPVGNDYAPIQIDLDRYRCEVSGVPERWLVCNPIHL